MSILEAIILGLIQGLTEFIPVSSSGHLLIAHEILGTSKNTLSFDVALHVGTLVALMVFFRKDLIDLAKNIHKKNLLGSRARLLGLATMPAVIAGLLFGDYIDETLRTPAVVAITLASVGVVMLLADKVTKKDFANKGSVSTKQALFVGFAQALALIPGVSRSGATITAGIFSGLDRVSAARFSFLLAVPIIAGSALGILIQEPDSVSTGAFQLGAGMLVAFISGLGAIKFLLGVIAKVGLRPFALYRIIAAVVVLIFLV